MYFDLTLVENAVKVSLVTLMYVLYSVNKFLHRRNDSH